MRWLLVPVVLFALAVPCAAQRDPEKPMPQLLQPAPAAPQATPAEHPAPALSAFLAVGTTIAVLVLICKPSRKGA